MVVIDCIFRVKDPINVAQSEGNENYLLEPLGKSTTKEDHERIQMRETEREK